MEQFVHRKAKPYPHHTFNNQYDTDIFYSTKINYMPENREHPQHIIIVYIKTGDLFSGTQERVTSIKLETEVKDVYSAVGCLHVPMLKFAMSTFVME